MVHLECFADSAMFSYAFKHQQSSCGDRDLSGKEEKVLTRREAERAQVRANMRRWVRLRERFDTRSNYKKTDENAN